MRGLLPGQPPPGLLLVPGQCQHTNTMIFNKCDVKKVNHWSWIILTFLLSQLCSCWSSAPTPHKQLLQAPSWAQSSARGPRLRNGTPLTTRQNLPSLKQVNLFWQCCLFEFHHSFCSFKFYTHMCRLLLPVPALWRGWPDHHQRALPQLHLPQPDADVLPQVQHSQHHLCQICHANKFHQGVPVHQTSGSELCGGEEGQPVLSDHILPPRSVSSHSDSQKT